MRRVSKLKNRAREEEQRENWSNAIDLYTKALRASERDGDSVADLSLYNRIGDIHLRLGDQEAAVEYYEGAIDRYSEQDLHSSAIALCNKILRIVPTRASIYRRLGSLHAATGLIAEARVNYFRFVAAAQDVGDREEVLAALEECVERTGDQEACLRLVDELRASEEPDEAMRRLANLERRLVARGIDARALLEVLVELGGEPAGDEESEAISLHGITPEPDAIDSEPELDVVTQLELEVLAPESEPIAPEPEVVTPEPEVVTPEPEPIASDRFPVPFETEESERVEKEGPASFRGVGLEEIDESETVVTRAESAGASLRSFAPFDRSEPPGLDLGAVRVTVRGCEPSESGASRRDGGHEDRPIASRREDASERPVHSRPATGPRGLSACLAERTERPLVCLPLRAARREPWEERVEEPFRGPSSLLVVTTATLDPFEIVSVPPSDRPSVATPTPDRTEKPSRAVPGPALAPYADESEGALITEVSLEKLLASTRRELSGSSEPASADSLHLEEAGSVALDLEPVPGNGRGLGGSASTLPGPVSPPADERGTGRFSKPEPAESATYPAFRADPASWAEVAESAHPRAVAVPGAPSPSEAAESAGPAPSGVVPMSPPSADPSEIDPSLDRGELADAIGAELAAWRERGLVEPEPMPVPPGPTARKGDCEADARPDHAFHEFVVSAPRDLLLRIRHELESRGELRKTLVVVERLLELDPTRPELEQARESLAARLSGGEPAAEHEEVAAAPKRRADEATRGEDAEEREGEMIPEPMSQSFFDGTSGHLEPSPSGDPSDAFVTGEVDPKPRPYAGVAGGEERATNFEKLLDELKQELAEPVPESDAQTRTELGASLKEMGLLDDAIRELQAAVREPHAPPQAFEMLGEAFIEKGQPRVAARLLAEALKENPRGDRELLGVLYQLGVAYQQVDEPSRALDCYERIFSVDIDYRDVKDRILACST